MLHYVDGFLENQKKFVFATHPIYEEFIFFQCSQYNAVLPFRNRNLFGIKTQSIFRQKYAKLSISHAD